MLWIPRHPNDPTVYNVLNPMYWIIGLSGYEFDKTPIEVSLNAGPAFPATLVRKRIDYSIPDPNLEMALPGPTVAAALAIAGGVTLTATGDDTRLKLFLDHAPTLSEAVHHAMPHCGR